MSYDKLTKNRKFFIEQLHDLINNQFKAQQNLGNDPKKVIKELENNPNYLQRIFIDASWGMGKTYFADAFKELVTLKEKEPKIEVITINSWETDYFSDPMKSIIGEINDKNLISPETQEIAENIIINIFKAGSKIILKLFLKKAKFNDDDIEELKSIFTGINTSELQDYKNYKKLVDEFKEKLSLEDKLKLIIIDELDRCKPSYAIELLETVKHFFGVKNIIFVFLINKEQLKSIISTSYIAEDKCSEYFEKFFDIEFKLPEVDYEDFIEIEYKKYEEFNTYEPQFVRQNMDLIIYSSDKKDKFYESIFLEVFKSNCNGKIVSIRNLIKSFKKFTILLSSLSDDIKNIYPLMIVLIFYFIQQEFFSKKIEIEEDRKSYSLEVLFFKTFFNINSNEDTVPLVAKEIFQRKYKIKDKYIENSSYYKNFYNILNPSTYIELETWYSNEDEKIDDIYHYGIHISNEFGNYKENISLKIEQKNNIIFYDVRSCLQYNISTPYLLLKKDIFDFINIDNFKSENGFYYPNLLEEWAKLKYNFILN